MVNGFDRSAPVHAGLEIGGLGANAHRLRGIMPRIVDLSVTIENNMPAHKNMPRPVYLEWE